MSLLCNPKLRVQNVIYSILRFIIRIFYITIPITFCSLMETSSPMALGRFAPWSLYPLRMISRENGVGASGVKQPREPSKCFAHMRKADDICVWGICHPSYASSYIWNKTRLMVFYYMGFDKESHFSESLQGKKCDMKCAFGDSLQAKKVCSQM